MHAQLALIAIEDGRIVVKLGRADETLSARLMTRFNGRVKAAKDRAWLAGPGDDTKWQQHLMDVISAMRLDKAEKAS